MKATAIIPVKRFGRAKQRLLDTLDRPQRADLVKAMLDDVLVAVSETPSIERNIVVTRQGRAERIALASEPGVERDLADLRDELRQAAFAHDAHPVVDLELEVERRGRLEGGRGLPAWHEP